MTDTTPYFHFLESLVPHALNPNYDLGLMTDQATKNLIKAIRCKHNIHNPNRSLFPCRICEVCRGNQVYRQFLSINQKTLSPLHHTYYSVVLSLPKWVDGMFDKKECNTFGELFFTTPHLFHSNKDVPLNSILSGFRKQGVRSIQQCFPEVKLGMFVGLHLVNDFMQFSPHLHVILCGTALDHTYLPLKMDDNGCFPTLSQAWRTPLGGRRGMSVSTLKDQLLINWADSLSSYSVSTFQQYRSGYDLHKINTQNTAYRILSQMSESDIQALQPMIRSAILHDSNCVFVKKIDTDPRTGGLDPEMGYKFALKYALSRPFKNIAFTDLGDGNVTALHSSNLASKYSDDRSNQFIGSFETVKNRMLQFFSVFRVRRYQGYGLFHSGKGQDSHKMLIIAMNKGYPRPISSANRQATDTQKHHFK